MFGRDRRADMSTEATNAADQFVKNFSFIGSGTRREILSSHPNPLESFFDRNTEGPGIWKWQHYFDLYHRHFEKFKGTPVRIMEIGIYSGGSLRMWNEYFGPEASIYGVDIEPSCKIYESDNIFIKIGDQQSREFWRSFLKETPKFDIVIDDGGHEYQQQRVTLEEILPHMAPGGVYICEDVHETNNQFGAYAARLATHLNESANLKSDETNDERRLTNIPSNLQKYIKCVSFYAFSTVIELQDEPLDLLFAAKHGTQWQPFLK